MGCQESQQGFFSSPVHRSTTQLGRARANKRKKIVHHLEGAHTPPCLHTHTHLPWLHRGARVSIAVFVCHSETRHPTWECTSAFHYLLKARPQPKPNVRTHTHTHIYTPRYQTGNKQKQRFMASSSQIIHPGEIKDRSIRSIVHCRRWCCK